MYNAQGNRLWKRNHKGQYTIYIRDGQGNVLSIYEAKDAGEVIQTEIPLYGSSRLGIWRANRNATDCGEQPNLVTAQYTGHKRYELSDHLGNVLALISDKKLEHNWTGGNEVDQWLPDVVEARDYYAFGGDIVGRSYNSTGQSGRYGFNGKEDDADISEGGQDYGMRISDRRLGRFFSVDPLTKEYAWLTPFQYASNSPIWMLDLDGMEGVTFDDVWNNRVSFVTWINDPQTWVKGAQNINENLNPLYQAYEHVYEISTATDARTGLPKSRVQATYDATANVMLWLTMQRATKLLTFRQPLETQMNANARAMGQVKRAPAQQAAAQATEAKLVSTPHQGAAKNVVVNTAEQLAARYKLNRPKHKQSTIQRVWNEAKDIDGNVYDPNTGELLSWDKFKTRFNQWHLGHKPGHEYRTLLERLRKGEIDEKTFLKEYHDASHYQPEAPASNMSHRFEAKTN